MYFYPMDFISERLLDYATNHSEPVPPLLKALARETHQKVLQPRMLSGALQGRFLSLLSKVAQPKRILEIGTFTGYATLCLAEGLNQEGEIHTIDCNEELMEFQKKYFDKSPFAHQIHQHLGEALDVIPQLQGTFDLVFIDADKKNYPNYFESLIPKINKGGLIISDNVLWSGKVLEEAGKDDLETIRLQKFNKKMASDTRISSLLLPLRDGLTLSRVL